MGKLNGGVFLLNLTMITLALASESSTITNEYVLSQLDRLKNYIANPNSKKPLWVQFVDEDGQHVVVQGSIQQIDNQFLLMAETYLRKLEIAVTFDQDEETFEWYIDSATILYTENEKITGDLEITDDLHVGGILKVDDYELDEDITISDLPEGLTCYYAHARVSNGKLNIVVAFNSTTNISITASSLTKIGTINVSSDVYNKLIPYVSTVLATKYGFITSSNWQADGITKLQVKKDNDVLELYLIQSAVLSVPGTGDLRFEFNFIL